MISVSLKVSIVAVCFAELAACTAYVPDETPVFSDTISGNYVALADCTFLRLQNNMGQITRTSLDSAKTVQIARGECNLIYWSLQLADAGKDMTKAVFRSREAVWGHDFYANQVVPELRACAKSS